MKNIADRHVYIDYCLSTNGGVPSSHSVQNHGLVRSSQISNEIAPKEESSVFGVNEMPPLRCLNGLIFCGTFTFRRRCYTKMSFVMSNALLSLVAFSVQRVT